MKWIRPGLLLIILVVTFALSKNYFVGLFFLPDTYIVGSPRDHGVEYDDIYFSSKGQKLHGLFLKTTEKPKGTIIQCHGNAGNVSCHFQLMLFLVKAGYHVFIFDYQGYGQSEGKPSPEGIIEDTLAAIKTVRERPDVDPKKLILFGQSLGGAAAAGAMARDKTIQALILEATFTTYQDMAWKTALGRMLFFLTPFVIPDIGPIDHLDDIAPRPLFILHGTDDGLIPASFAKDLYKAASHKKRLSLIQGYRHLHGEDVLDEYQKEILSFLSSLSNGQ